MKFPSLSILIFTNHVFGETLSSWIDLNDFISDPYRGPDGTDNGYASGDQMISIFGGLNFSAGALNFINPPHKRMMMILVKHFHRYESVTL